jgi:hypothetical protein
LSSFTTHFPFELLALKAKDTSTWLGPGGKIRPLPAAAPDVDGGRTQLRAAVSQIEVPNTQAVIVSVKGNAGPPYTMLHSPTVSV